MDSYTPQERDDAARILDFLRELSADLGNEFIVIGGWAVYAYRAKELSLDGDAMISYQAQGILRDLYPITKNARMHKEQFVGPSGHDIDLYVENQHALPVSFRELQAGAKQKEGLWVACPEHLIVLKLAAARDRSHTPKGRKDRADLALLFEHAPDEFNRPELLAAALEAKDWEQLHAVCRDRELTDELCGGNQWEGKLMRERLTRRLWHIEAEGMEKLRGPAHGEEQEKRQRGLSL